MSFKESSKRSFSSFAAFFFAGVLEVAFVEVFEVAFVGVLTFDFAAFLLVLIFSQVFF
jgi:hypothetical protein